MQNWAKPWAKRGVQAALVTGGMLAAGTGVAAASEDCPDRPAPPLGESALSPANSPSLRHGIPCFAGEIFPEYELPDDPHYNAPIDARSAKHPITALSGSLDPLPPRDAARSTERPHHPWIPPEENSGKKVRIANWNMDTDRLHGRTGNGGSHARSLDVQPGHSDLLFGLIPLGGQQRQVPSGTPAQGFHRSLSWSGPIGDIVDEVPRDALADTIPHGPSGLVRPSANPAVFDGFAEPGGIVELWRSTLGRGLLAPDTVDLTSAELNGPRPEFRSVPPELLTAVIDRPAERETQRERNPLEVPGEHQLKANEVPDLLGELALLELSQAPNTVERDADPGLHAPLPLGGQLNALSGGESSLPAVSRIIQALNGTPTEPAEEPRFSRKPLEHSVLVSTLDDLAAAVPEQKLVTRDPFSSGPRAAALPEMRLPLGEGALLPDLTAVQGETLPMPALDGDLLDSLTATAPIPRLVGNA